MSGSIILARRLTVKDFVIVEFVKHTDIDGKWWIEARSECGHTIAIAKDLRLGLFEVMVNGPTDNRAYSGHEGSQACDTYTRFYDGYQHAKMVFECSTQLSPNLQRGSPVVHGGEEALLLVAVDRWRS